jgi:hypothetical protein
LAQTPLITSAAVAGYAGATCDGNAESADGAHNDRIAAHLEDGMRSLLATLIVLGACSSDGGGFWTDRIGYGAQVKGAMLDKRGAVFAGIPYARHARSGNDGS